MSDLAKENLELKNVCATYVNMINEMSKQIESCKHEVERKDNDIKILKDNYESLEKEYEFCKMQLREKMK